MENETRLEPSVFDFDAMKKLNAGIVYAYSGSQIHSIFVMTHSDDISLIKQQVKSFQPCITKTEILQPTPDVWKFIEQHQDDDLGYNPADDVSDQIKMFNQQKVILWLDEKFMIKPVQSFQR